jgi:hypothetical protein
MPIQKTEELRKKTLNFREGDFEKMGQLFPDLGASAAIRRLISRFVDKHLPDEDPEPVDLPDIEI